jgi:hypothetical protein
MAMVGFSFTKLNAERKQSTGASLNIESNAGVTNVIEIPTVDSKKALLKFEFVFTVKYEPNAGKIELGGEVVEIYDKDFGTKVMEHWNKEKKVLTEAMKEIFNNILSRSNVEAIMISRDLGLPSPIQMPRLDVKPRDKSKVDSKSEPKTDSKAEKAKK